MTVTQHTLWHSTATSKLTIPCRVAIAQRRVDIITVALTHQSSIAVYNNFRDYFSSLFCTRRHTHTLESAIGQFHICNIIFRIFFSSLIFRPLAAKHIAVSTPNGLRSVEWIVIVAVRFTADGQCTVLLFIRQHPSHIAFIHYGCLVEQLNVLKLHMTEHY